MRKKSLKPLFLSAWVCVGILSILAVQEIKHDRTAALLAGAIFLISVLFSVFVLDLALSSAPLLYLLLLGLFHLGLVVPWAAGIYDIDRVAWFDFRGLLNSLVLVMTAVISFQIGILIGTIERTVERPVVVHPRQLHAAEVFYPGILLLLLGICMFFIGLVILAPGDFYNLTYSETYRLRAESDPRLFGNGIVFAAIGSGLAAAGASKKQLRFVILIVAIWLLWLIFFGFRGHALLAGILVFAITIRKGFHFPRWSLWMTCGVLLVVIPLVRQVREAPLAERAKDFSLEDLNFVDTFAEMGGSLRTLIETENLVDEDNYRYGKTYLYALKPIIPNLALSWKRNVQISEDDLPPSHWITIMVEPLIYRNYGGLGFSGIAEPYMNFGPIGVIFYFLLLGFALVKLEKSMTPGAHSLAVWALVVGPLLWTVRNDFHNFFRPVAWGFGYYLLGAFLWKTLLQYLRRDSLPDFAIGKPAK